MNEKITAGRPRKVVGPCAIGLSLEVNSKFDLFSHARQMDLTMAELARSIISAWLLENESKLPPERHRFSKPEDLEYYLSNLRFNKKAKTKKEGFVVDSHGGFYGDATISEFRKYIKEEYYCFSNCKNLSGTYCSLRGNINSTYDARNCCFYEDKNEPEEVRSEDSAAGIPPSPPRV
jgi:hypothetical protein